MLQEVVLKVVKIKNNMAKKKTRKNIALDSPKTITKLIILALLKKGTKKGITSEEIGRVLGVDSSVIRRLVPIRKSRKAKKK